MAVKKTKIDLEALQDMPCKVMDDWEKFLLKLETLSFVLKQAIKSVNEGPFNEAELRKRLINTIL